MKRYFSSLRVALLIVFASTVFISRKSTPEQAAVVEKEVASVPGISDIVMYEVFVHNFSAEGTFNALTARLDRQSTAVNATLNCVERQGVLTPVNRSWTLNCPAAAGDPIYGNGFEG